MKDLIWRNLSKQIPIEEASFSHHLKGLFTDFAVGMHGSVSSSEIQFTLGLFNIFYPCGRYGFGGAVRNRPPATVRGVVGPCRYTIKSTLTATESDKIKMYKK